MAGLLGQLQKNKGRSSGDTGKAVIRTAPEQYDFSIEEIIGQVQAQNKKPQAPGEVTLSEQEPGSASLAYEEPPQLRLRYTEKVVRQKAVPKEESAQLDEDSPPWLSSERRISTQLEQLIAQAAVKLPSLLADVADDLGRIDAVRRAVSLAAELVREGSRLTRRVIEEAEMELLLLVQGKGPLAALYEDSAVSEIFVDNHRSIKVIRRGEALETPFSFRSGEEYQLFLSSMLASANRSLSPDLPIVDCVIPDQWHSRVNVVDPSLIEGDEPRLAIRIPRLQKIAFYDLLHTKTLPPTLASWLSEIVASGEANILVAGPSGSGKTVMMTALLGTVGSNERIIAVEDVPEVFVPTAHLEKLVARPGNGSSQREVTTADLLRASLRRAAKRLVLGEIREEAGGLFLRALETGRAGSIATIHAHSAVDALWSLLDLIAEHEMTPQESIMRRIARSIHLVITMKKIDGRPCLIDVSEVLKPEGGDFLVQPLVQFLGKLKEKRQWQIKAENSSWLERVAARGVLLSPGPGLRPFVAKEPKVVETPGNA